MDVGELQLVLMVLDNAVNVTCLSE